MVDNITNILAARTTYINYLEQDIKRNDKILEETNKEVHELENLAENIKTLGIYPEHSAMIPLAKNIYMKGTIKHTGEYYVTKPAHPQPYVLLQSLGQTVNTLENNIKLKKGDIERVEYAKYQLEERMKLLKGDNDDIILSHDDVPETNDMPKEIKSDKGVALKVGEFYEILEYEED